MSDRSTVLVLGGTGQIGHEVARRLAWLGPVVTPTRQQVDLTRLETLHDLIRRAAPKIVVNAAAYTAVDAAELDVDACMRLNAELPDVLATECRAANAVLVHFSTDYVFDGTKGTPYVETDEPRPLNVYGASKLAGERAIADAGGAYLIFRTSWVYAARGRNFARTILRLAREHDVVSVVNDQVGAPTSAPAIAGAVSQVLRGLDARDIRQSTENASGIYHLTASGSTTWYDFARAILAGDPRVRPVTTSEYRTAARRPAYSLLDNTKLENRFGVGLPSWTEQWRAVADELRLAGESVPNAKAERH